MPCLICEFYLVWICVCGASMLILLATSSMLKRHRLDKIYTYEFTLVPFFARTHPHTHTHWVVAF